MYHMLRYTSYQESIERLGETNANHTLTSLLSKKLIFPEIAVRWRNIKTPGTIYLRFTGVPSISWGGKTNSIYVHVNVGKSHLFAPVHMPHNILKIFTRPPFLSTNDMHRTRCACLYSPNSFRGLNNENNIVLSKVIFSYL